MTATELANLALRILLGWSLLSLGTSVLGLYASSGAWSRAFWFMSGLWGLIDGAIVLAGLVTPLVRIDDLRTLFGMNAILDIAYLTTALFLVTRDRPLLRGFGSAILVQGAFLLLFDSAFWLLCP